MDTNFTTTVTTTTEPNDFALVMEMTLNTLQEFALREKTVSEEREKTDQVFQDRIQSQSQAMEKLTIENGQTKLALVKSEERNRQLVNLSEEQKKADQILIKTQQDEIEKLRIENEKLMKLLEEANQKLAPKPPKPPLTPQERAQRVRDRMKGRM